MMTDRPPGLYVHVPFCRGKCPYCDFYSLSAPKLIPVWLEGLAGEIELVREKWTETFDTLYFGGGTPSTLSNDTITECFRLVRATFNFSPDTEITFEVNPEDASPEKISLLKELGVRRISLGVQSFHQEELGFLGRRHTTKSIKKALGIVKDSGAALSLDLIYGLPIQSLEKWIENLETALTYEPEHISCYALTPEYGTAFDRLVQSREIIMPSEEMDADFFEETSNFLGERGYIHYEISNFGYGAQNRSRHNSKYWDHTWYLGLGPSAHSYKNGVRWWNQRSIRNYAKMVANGQPPEAGREVLTGEQFRLEKIYLGLRTQDGISMDFLTRNAKNIAGDLVAGGLANKVDGRLVLTRKGMCLADRLALELCE